MNSSTTNNILILIEQLTPRIKYVFQHIFENILGINTLYTQHKDEFVQSLLPKINYTSYSLKEGLQIVPSRLLYHDGIDRTCIPEVTIVKGMPVIFKSNADDALGFDVFSAIFYVLSRYEEYIFQEYDNHGRFLPQKSIFYASGALAIPVVDLWIDLLKDKISRLYSQISFKQHQYTYLPTIDVDMPYAFRYKKLPYALAGILKNVIHSDWKTLTQRFRVLLKKEEDPYYTYNFINRTVEKHSLRPLYFYLCQGSKPYDPIASYRFKAVKQVVSQNTSRGITGLHNSYHTLEQPDLITKELYWLQTAAKTSVFCNRFHFIRFRLPSSYQHILEAGIREDYSMGYASINGFRAGTAHPFQFYDLSSETITSLKIIPFQAMDATYIHYLNISPEKAFEDLSHIREKVKKYNGTLVVIWHNNTFEPTPQGMQWRKVFEAMFD